MSQQEDTQPLLTRAEEKDRAEAEKAREIAYRCETVERACRYLGFEEGCGYERVATLVARTVGWGILDRTLDEIANDHQVELSRRHAKRAIEELIAEGILVDCGAPSPDESPEATKRRGRRPKTWFLKLNRERVSSLVAASSGHIRSPKTPPSKSPESPENPSVEFRASSGHLVGTSWASSGHLVGTSWASSGHLEKHTVLNPITLSPSPSPEKERVAAMVEDQESGTSHPGWSAAAAAVQAAGVNRVAALIDEWRRAGMSASELLDAAYVVQHTPKLNGGALFDYLRNHRCWPSSGVKPAGLIRSERKARADAIRESTDRDAKSGNRSVQPFQVIAVAVRRLRAAGLDDQVTERERQLMKELESQR